MFNGCESLKMLDLSSFNADKASTINMFNGCNNLSSCGSKDKKIVDAFNEK